MNNTTHARLLAATALMAFATLAQAQYLWIDAKGLKHFSDRAPPPSIPLKNILKSPPGVSTAVLVPTEQAGAAPAPVPVAARPKAAPTVADRNADYNKRQKDRIDLEQKEKDEREAAVARTEHCEALRATKRSFESGERIGVQSNSGERGYMTDHQRTVESAKVDKALAACK